MIQDGELIRNRHAGSEKFAKGVNDAVWSEVPFRIIVLANNQDTWMMASGHLHQVMQLLEVIVVERQKHPDVGDSAG
jgi:hypothetical protein